MFVALSFFFNIRCQVTEKLQTSFLKALSTKIDWNEWEMVALLHAVGFLVSQVKIGLWIWSGLALVKEMCACDSWCSCLPLPPFSNLCRGWGGILYILCCALLETWNSFWCLTENQHLGSRLLSPVLFLLLSLMRCFHSCSVTTYSPEIHWKTSTY